MYVDCADFLAQTKSRTRYAGRMSKTLARLTSTPNASAKSAQGQAICVKARRAVSFWHGAEMTYTLGPGDSETWPPFVGHPHDPRSPENDSDDTTEEALVDVAEYMADALSAYRMNDRNEYDRVLREAAKAINTMLGESK